jgi:hypothetical protein
MRGRESQQRSLLDWRFLVCLLLIGSFAWVIWNGVQTQSNFRESQSAGKAKDARIGTLINAIQEQTDRTALNTAAFESNQRILLAYTAALADRQAALLKYLAEHGVRIPEKFLTPVTVPSISSTSTSGGTVTPHTSVKKTPKKAVKKKAMPPKSHKGGKRRR